MSPLKRPYFKIKDRTIKKMCSEISRREKLLNRMKTLRNILNIGQNNSLNSFTNKNKTD
jgi:hypothetical protein